MEKTYTIDPKTLEMVRACLAIEDLAALESNEIQLSWGTCYVSQDDQITIIYMEFDENYVIAIELDSGSTNYFINPVFFKKDGGILREIGCLDCPDDIIGDYSYEIDGEDYTLHVLAEEDN